LLEHGRRLVGGQTVSGPAVLATLVATELHLGEGRLAEAQLLAHEALELATVGGLPREEGKARRLLGQCALAEGDTAAATTHLRDALALQEKLGLRLEAARTRVALAPVLDEGSAADTSREESRRLVSEARAQFTASGALLDLAQLNQSFPW
jgi:hypothetical protein